MRASRTYRQILLLVLHVVLAGAVKDKDRENLPKSLPSVLPVNLNEISPGDIKPIFNAMREYGEAERNRINREQNTRVKQFLVVAVLSEDELRNAKNWKNGFPDTFTSKDGEQMKRLAFLLNKRDHDLPFYNPDRELHGEVHAIDLGPLERLLDNFKEDTNGKPRYPLVLMYSHYIPCAMVPGLGYSCAEEIKNYAKGNKETFRMLVGYTEFFKNTDVSSSLEFMKDGGLVAFQAKDDSYMQTVKYFPPSSIDREDSTFQKNYFECLMDLPVSKCCTGAQKYREKIVAFFINDITYTCTSGSTTSGHFTERSRNEVKACIGKQIDDRIGDDCRSCSTKDPKVLAATKGLFKFCLHYSVDSTEFLGQPKDPFDPHSPEWTPYTGAWKNLYRQPPQKSREHKHKVMCGNWITSIDSMCTQIEAAGNKKQKKLLKIISGDKYSNFWI